MRDNSFAIILALISAITLLNGCGDRTEAQTSPATRPASPETRPASPDTRPARSELPTRIGTFDTSYCTIPKDEILDVLPADRIPALTDPNIIQAGQAGYLRADDRIIGVEINGEARAYPLRILIWHENANDTLGGKPIAVSYCPLCDSALVFDRRAAGETLTFKISGKLYNSNVLMYDTQSKSLWSQLHMKAVCGPAAEQGLKLELLPSELVTWEDWKNRYPQTTVLSKNTGHQRDYVNLPYGDYFESDRLMMPVDMPEEMLGLNNKDLVVAVTAGGETRAYPVPFVLEEVGKGGTVEDTLGGVKIRLTHDPESEGLKVRTAEGEVPKVAYTFWFAWRAFNPEGDVWTGSRKETAG